MPGRSGDVVIRAYPSTVVVRCSNGEPIIRTMPPGYCAPAEPRDVWAEARAFLGMPEFDPDSPSRPDPSYDVEPPDLDDYDVEAEADAAAERYERAFDLF
jgi:hypothetical protein